MLNCMGGLMPEPFMAFGSISWNMGIVLGWMRWRNEEIKLPQNPGLAPSFFLPICTPHYQGPRKRTSQRSHQSPTEYNTPAIPDTKSCQAYNLKKAVSTQSTRISAPSAFCS